MSSSKKNELMVLLLFLAAVCFCVYVFFQMKMRLESDAEEISSQNEEIASLNDSIGRLHESLQNMNDAVFHEQALYPLGNFSMGGIGTFHGTNAVSHKKIRTDDYLVYISGMTVIPEEGYLYDVFWYDSDNKFREASQDNGVGDLIQPSELCVKFRLVLKKEDGSIMDISEKSQIRVLVSKLYSQKIQSISESVESAGDADSQVDLSGAQKYFGQKISLEPLFRFSTVRENISDVIKQKVDFDSTVVEGMDIYEGKAFITMKNGGVIVYDITKDSVVGQFKLESAAKTNHANNANFGNKYYSTDDYPLLYVSECSGKQRCFVERVQNDSSELVQTISFKNENDELVNYYDWIPDTEMGRLLAYGNTKNGKHMIKVFSLPDTKKNVTLREKDVIDQWVLEDQMGTSSITTYQGATVYNNMLFVPQGNYGDNAIYVFDLSTHEMIAAIPIEEYRELEDVSVYDGFLYVLAQSPYGSLFKIKFL